MAEQQQSVNEEYETLSKFDKEAIAELAGEARAVQGEAVEGAEGGDRDLLGPEEFAGYRLDFLAGYRFDAGENFVERVEAAEVEFLAREVGHPRAGGLEREHQRTFEVVLGAQELFFGDQ